MALEIEGENAWVKNGPMGHGVTRIVSGALRYTIGVLRLGRGMVHRLLAYNDRLSWIWAFCPGGWRDFRARVRGSALSAHCPAIPRIRRTCRAGGRRRKAPAASADFYRRRAGRAGPGRERNRRREHRVGE